MGKKAKGKKGKGGKKKKQDEAPPEEPSEFDNYEPEQLEEEITLLRSKLEKARMDRNYVQLERDTIQTFFDITKKEVKECEIATLTKDREMESMEENHRVEVRVYIQKVKHLEYEHRNNVKRVSHQGQAAITDEDEQYSKRSIEQHKAKRSLKMELMENENANEERIKLMKEAHAKNLQKLKETFEGNLESLNAKYESRLHELQADLELRRKVETHEIEERKNLHINDLMVNHEKAFGQIKSYYNDITQDNLKLIKSLKEEVAEMKTKATANQKLMYDIAQENKQLSEPLTVAVKEVEQLKGELKDYDKDKTSLKNVIARKRLLEKQLEKLQIVQQELEQKYQNVEEDRNKLYATFESTIADVQRKADLKNLVLERKLGKLRENHNEKAVQLNELCRDVDPVMLGEVTRKLDESMEKRNALIAELEYQVMRVQKAHNDAVRTFRETLIKLGIPEEELVQVAEEVTTATSTNPAGLVVKAI